MPLTGRDGSTPFSRITNPLQSMHSEIGASSAPISPPRFPAVKSQTKLPAANPQPVALFGEQDGPQAKQVRQICAS